ncbi:MAG TPA: undecaprenyldiphospho-muramoylpentapeptide beta-N-acetylglucosaminyltransferase [Bryobacteraceae bacterium]|jgi:UDP-N-acetylglucosamine--N-acetylmuramyl-(pentapeptide) pyrophosphoryl-undecaprenol N-acetylglucosamine transferase|nr:undecaprenyldiphospho-muramoylpentapeptide beta-N-acetylglucosaminyltransferase [Bryobacteraceae bacterium]
MNGEKPMFLMAGGGTGGHVIPAIAVAREVDRMGYEVLFVGTERGVENRMVPAAGFRLEKIRVGGLKNLGIATRAISLWRLITETAGQVVRFAEWKPAAVFSMGGYVAGPPVLAALVRGVPLVVMEPNAVPGFTNRHIARWVNKALISFEETRRFFPKGRTELTGRPVREEFFEMQPKTGGEFTVLITGGSQGSRTLNNAARQSWPLFQSAELPVRFIHQTGAAMYESVKGDFEKSGMAGEVTAFIADMAEAFGQADLIVCRSGGTVSELAASGKPSLLIPFPFAADQHQQKNAEAFVRAGAARMFLDRDWTGERFFEIVRELYNDREQLRAMGEAARKLARPGAARRAAEILVEAAGFRIDSVVAESKQ